MRFHIAQSFDHSADEVQAAYLDPAFIAAMGNLPKLGSPELLEDSRDGATVRRRVRYRFAGDLNSAVRAVIDPERLTWVEESVVDVADRRTRWKIVPDHYGDRLSSSGEFLIEPDGEGGGTAGSRRVARGEVKVHMFLVGSKVEAAIVSGMKEHAAAERDAIGRYLEST